MSIKSTYRRIALLAATIIAMVTTVAAAESFEGTTDDRCIAEYRTGCDESSTSSRNAEFDEGYEPLVALCSSTSSSSVAPAVRTLYGASRPSARTSTYTRAVSAIDSTTVSQRYGLFNHKILFTSLPRIHYLCRLMRLII